MEKNARVIADGVKVVFDGGDIFIVVGSVRIAKRGKPGTPQAKTWISLEPGWEVVGGGEESDTIAIRHSGLTVQ